jgi:HK97 family phage major capsid protein
MPVIGGDIVDLDFVPDDNIVAGYGDDYLLVERAGAQLASSEHFLFTSDKTVFKGTARYDGLPVIAEGFVVIGVNNVTPATTVTFAADTANT